MANPADMTDEELDKVIETGVVPEEPEAPAEESPSEPEDTTPEEPDTPEAPEEPAPEPEPKEDEGEDKPPSRRETLRVQQLLKKYGPPQERPQPSQPKLDYREVLEADNPELYDKLEADRKTYAEANYNAGLEQAKSLQFHTRLEIDAPRVEDKYKFLNPNDKERFHPALADGINSLYLTFAGYDPGDAERGVPESVQNPNIRYSDTVEMIMELAEEIANTKNAQSVKNITKQAATTGLRPDGSSAKVMNLNKPAHQMTDEELEAKIAQSFS